MPTHQGTLTPEAYSRIVRIYGKETARGILGTVRLIMFGNAHGIAATLLKDRLTGNSQKGSSFWKEIGITLGPLLILPVMLIKGIFAKREVLPE